jgi:hypothetical protein
MLALIVLTLIMSCASPSRVVVKEKPAPPVVVVRPAPPYQDAVWVGVHGTGVMDAMFA